MKTISELNALISQLVGLVIDNPDIGECYYGRCEADYEETWATNCVSYEEDGWYIEISFRCCGEWDKFSGDYLTPASCSLLKAWGEITDIQASHYDEENNEETVFSDNDLADIWAALSDALEQIC